MLSMVKAITRARNFRFDSEFKRAMILSRTKWILIGAVTVGIAAASPAPAAVTVGHSGWAWGSPRPQGETLQAVEFAGSRGYAAGAFGTLLRSDDGGGSWSGTATGIQVPLKRIALIDADSLVVGGGCAVRRSDDGGETFTRLPWTATDLRCAAPVASFDFPADQAGYLVLEDGSVLSTADGGRSWSRKTAVPESRAVGGSFLPTDVVFTTADTGLVTTTAGRIYRTTDGAASWTLVRTGSPALRGLHFVSGLIGYAVGDSGAVLQTADGGTSWLPKAPAGDLKLQSIRCADALTCLIATDSGQSVLRTIDGGVTYATVSPSTQKVFAATFSSPTRAVAAGADGTTVVSDDAGATWKPIGRRLDGGFARLRAVSTSLVFAVGSNGALARSEDGGLTWAEVGVSTSEDVIDVSFADRLVGYALDAAGTLLRTDNGGLSWQILNTGTSSRPQAVLALGTTTVLLVGPKGAQRSTDGGQSFTRVRGRLLNRSKLFNVDRGGSAVFAYGSKNILVSTNAGRSWKKVRLPRKALIQAVDFVTARNGFMLGQDGQVFKTRNRGARWLDMSGVGSDDATGLSFSSPSRGYLALRRFGADAGGYLLRTTDGGRTWRPQLVASDQPSPDGLAATGSNSAFALIGSQTLLFTTTGGDRGDRSKVTIRVKRRAVRRRSVIRVSGKVSGAGGGAQVLVSRRERGESGWVSQAATVASNGTFTTTWKLVKTAAFVAQWAGDENSAGDGSPALLVRAKRR
jgi:photosystem II stability/assembly factor-like uncharacterized protein